jgi:hypothetical protein
MEWLMNSDMGTVHKEALAYVIKFSDIQPRQC